jgi:hypothetical protein
METAAATNHPWIETLLNVDRLSTKTRHTYKTNCLLLLQLANLPLEVVIRKPKRMYELIRQHYPNLQTRKAMASAVKAIYKYNPQLKAELPHSYEKWSEMIRLWDQRILNRVSTAEPTPREQKHWVTWENILKKRSQLGQNEYGSIRHLLLAMYSYIEPARADYGKVLVVFEDQDQQSLHDATDKSYIYLSSQPGSSKLSLSDYKTGKKYGKFERILPDDLAAIIRESLRLKPRKYLFEYEGKPYELKNSFGRFVSRTMETIFDGKRVSVTILRHSFISGLDFNALTPGELFTHSKNMMHSIATQQLYRRKIKDSSKSD